MQGVIEGLTEFLPVSSTGHMVLAEPWLGIKGGQPPWPVFRYFIQIGAILAVILYFWRRLWRQVLTKPDAGLSNHLLVKVGLAMIPGAVAGLALDDFMEAHLEKPIPVAVALIVGAFVMIVVERAYGSGCRVQGSGFRGQGKKETNAPKAHIPNPTSDIPHPKSDIPQPTSDIRHPTSDIRHPTSDIRHPTFPNPQPPTLAGIENVTLRQALAIGLAQCLSVIPGTSRAMATIMGGIAVGMPAPVAAEFSFYLAIPTLCGAGLLRIVKHWSEIRPEDAGLLGLGFSVAFVVALLVVAAFMRYLQTRPLWPFALYRIALGILVLLSL